jgi:signal transduction histidine kinase
MTLSKEDFYNTISHEIRTPLSILKIGIDNLKASCVGRLGKNENEIIEVLKRNVEKLETLVNDLIDRSRLEAEKEGE